MHHASPFWASLSPLAPAAAAGGHRDGHSGSVTTPLRHHSSAGGGADGNSRHDMMSMSPAGIGSGRRRSGFVKLEFDDGDEGGAAAAAAAGQAAAEPAAARSGDDVHSPWLHASSGSPTRIAPSSGVTSRLQLKHQRTVDDMRLEEEEERRRRAPGGGADDLPPAALEHAEQMSDSSSRRMEITLSTPTRPPRSLRTPRTNRRGGMHGSPSAIGSALPPLYASPHTLSSSSHLGVMSLSPAQPSYHSNLRHPRPLMDGNDSDPDLSDAAGSASNSPPHPLNASVSSSTPSSSATYLSPERRAGMLGDSLSTPFDTPGFSPNISTPRLPPASSGIAAPSSVGRSSVRRRTANAAAAAARAGSLNALTCSPAMLSPAPSGSLMLAAGGGRGARRALNAPSTEGIQLSTPSGTLGRTRRATSRAALFAADSSSAGAPHSPPLSSLAVSSASASTSPLLLGIAGSAGPATIGALGLGSLALAPGALGGPTSTSASTSTPAPLLLHAALSGGGAATSADQGIKIESGEAMPASDLFATGSSSAAHDVAATKLLDDALLAAVTSSGVSAAVAAAAASESNPNAMAALNPSSSSRSSRGSAGVSSSALLSAAAGATGAIPPASASSSSSSSSSSSAPHKPCSCKKSKCLKLYCECFARQVLCQGCNCTGCFNTGQPGEHAAHRERAVAGTMGRDPQAFFRAQIQAQQLQQQAAENKANKQAQQQQQQRQQQLQRSQQQQQLLHNHNQQQLAQHTALLAALQGGSSVTAAAAAAAVAAAAASSQALPAALVAPPPSAAAAAAGGVSKPFRKGCHCKKSECLKKYCECFQSGVACDPHLCKCVECKNGAGHGHTHHMHDGSAGAIAAAAAAAAAGGAGMYVMDGDLRGGGNKKRRGTNAQQQRASKMASSAAAAAMAAAAGFGNLFMPPQHYSQQQPSLQSVFTNEQMFALHSSLNAQMLPFITNEALLHNYHLAVQSTNAAHQAQQAATAAAAALAAATNGKAGGGSNGNNTSSLKMPLIDSMLMGMPLGLHGNLLGMGGGMGMGMGLGLGMGVGAGGGALGPLDPIASVDPLLSSPSVPPSGSVETALPPSSSGEVPSTLTSTPGTAASASGVQSSPPTRTSKRRRAAMEATVGGAETESQQMSPDVRSPSRAGAGRGHNGLSAASPDTAVATPITAFKRSQRNAVSSVKAASSAIASSKAPPADVSAGPLSSPVVVGTRSTRGGTRLSSTLDKLPSARELTLVSSNTGGGAADNMAGSADENRPAQQATGASASPGASPNHSPSSIAHRQKRARHVPQHFNDMQLI